LTREARLDLSWWIECFEIFHGSCAFKCDFPLPNYCFATDACPSGGGGFCGIDWFHVNWHLDYPEFEMSHINVLELLTVVVALKRWGPVLAGNHVRIRSDNTATVAALNKSTSRSSLLMPLVREIFWLCVEFDVALSCVYIPGKENILADRLSRMHNYEDAMDARLLLANFSDNLVMCVNQMSIKTFLYLQGIWTLGLHYL
jgi:hypothetical protein